MSDDPQDTAEAFDEETIDADPDGPGRFDTAPEEAYLADEELTVEPIEDSVASREARLDPEDAGTLAGAVDDAEVDLVEADLSEALISDEIAIASDEDDMSAEEAAIHLTD